MAMIIAKVIDNMASIGSMDMDSRVGLVQLGEPLKEMPKIKLSKSIDLDDTLAQMRKLTHSSAPLPSYLGDGFFTTYKQFDWTVPRHKLVWVVMNGKAMTRNHDAIKRSLYLKIHGATICATAIGHFADKDTLYARSGDKTGSHCYFEFNDWEPFHEAMKEVMKRI